MENASKALIIAGSVLISLVIIAALVFTYNKLTQLEQTKTTIDETGKITEYSKKIEQYNKTLYGSELLSLANLQDDYNKTQAGEKGYTAIKIQVTISKPVDYFFTGTNDIKELTKNKNNVEELIANYEKKQNYKGKTIKYYSQVRNREIAQIYGVPYASDEEDYDIGEKLKTNNSTKELMKKIEEYKNLVSSYTEFKSKQFKCTKITYDNSTGRVSSMNFEEKK